MEDEKQVTEEVTSDTEPQQTEQRTDDYDGLTRLIRDLSDQLHDTNVRIEELSKKVEGSAAMYVENGGSVNDSSVMDDIQEVVESKIDEVLGIDALDLM